MPNQALTANRKLQVSMVVCFSCPAVRGVGRGARVCSPSARLPNVRNRAKLIKRSRRLRMVLPNLTSCSTLCRSRAKKTNSTVNRCCRWRFCGAVWLPLVVRRVLVVCVFDFHHRYVCFCMCVRAFCAARQAALAPQTKAVLLFVRVALHRARQQRAMPPGPFARLFLSFSLFLFFSFFDADGA